MPEDVELEISRLAAQAAEKLLRKDQAEVGQRQAMQQQQDPLTQIQQREMSLKEAEFEHKKQIDIAKLKTDMEAKMGNIEVQKERIESEEKRMGPDLAFRSLQSWTRADGKILRTVSNSVEK